MRQSPLQLTPECRLVFLTAGGVGNDAALRELLGEEINWERALSIATQHKAVATLGRALQRLGAAGAVDSARERIRIQSMVSDFHMQHLEKRLRETLQFFSSSGVPVMLLKGAALGSTVYQSFRERPMADIDLLVRSDDSLMASLVAQKADWVAERDPDRAALYDTHHHLPPFRDARGSGHRLEIHTQPFPPPNPFSHVESDLWSESRAAPESLAGARIPAREHMLVYACIHFAWSHMISGGAWRTFRDVAALTERGIDWDSVVATAQRWKAASACYWTLRLAQLLSRSEAPPAVLTALRPPMLPATAALFERHFVSRIVPGERQSCPSVRANNMMWRAAMRPRWSGHGPHALRGDNEHWKPLATPERLRSGSTNIVSELRRWRRYLAGLMNAGIPEQGRLRPTPPPGSPRIPGV